MENKNKNKRKSALSIFFLLFNICILYYLVATDEQLTGEVSGLSQFNFFILIAAVIFILIYILIDVIKIYLLIKFYTGRCEPALSFKVAILGKYYDGITPFASGGQPFQIYHLTKDNINGAYASGIILIKYFIYQIVFFIFGILCLIVINITDISFNAFYILLFIISLSINLLLPLSVCLMAFHNKSTGKILNFFFNIGVKLRLVKSKENSLEKIQNIVSKFVNAFIVLRENIRFVLQLFLLTFLEVTLYILIPFIIYISYDPGIFNDSQFIYTLIKFSSLYLFVYFVMSIFPLPGGSGAAEFGFKWMMSSYFLSGTVSIAIILWRGITYYFPLLMGFVIFISDIIKKFFVKRNI